MGRANQLAATGGIFHVTHRCHNRAFLLKFACDRDAYREMLREQLCQFEVWLLDYCLEELRRQLEAALVEVIAQGKVEREALWTESLAVGSAGFVERIKPLLLSRRETEVIQTPDGLAILQELVVPYGQKTHSKNGANGQN